MNNATFAGRIGRDAETRHTQGGNSVTGWSLAVDEYAGQGERRTLWIDCSMWGERGEKLAEYLTKGKPVAVVGQIGVRTYESNGETRAAITLNVRDVTLLGGNQDGEGRDRQAPQQQRREQPTAREAYGASGRRSDGHGQTQRQAQPQQAADDFADDDIPF